MFSPGEWDRMLKEALPEKEWREQYKHQRAYKLEVTPTLTRLFRENVDRHSANTSSGLWEGGLTAFKSNDHRYSLALNKDGSIHFSEKFAGTWAGLGPPPRSEAIIAPPGTNRDVAVRLLEETFSLAPQQATRLYQHMESQLQQQKQEVPRSTHVSPTQVPHVILKPGDSISTLYHTIPEGKRPSFETFKEEFLQANVSVTNPNLVLAGKDYALPKGYDYTGLKTAKRLIEQSVADQASHAVAGMQALKNETGHSTLPVKTMRSAEAGSVSR